MPETRGLGKGIRALIPEGTPALKGVEVTRVPLRSIKPGRFQPRQNLADSKIHELADSIRESGLIYPLLVRKIGLSGDGEPAHELIAGERRLRALTFLEETEAPVIIKDMNDKEALQLSLIENIQREGLNPIEEALAYQRLAQEFGQTQDEIAKAVGKDRTTVANTVRLLKLTAVVREEVVKGRLTLGHARALLGLESEKGQAALAHRIVAEGLSVRKVEQLVKSFASGAGRTRAGRLKDPHLVAVQQQLQKTLGTNVEIFHGRSRGWIKIAYYSLKDLDRLIAHMSSRSSSS